MHISEQTEFICNSLNKINIIYFDDLQTVQIEYPSLEAMQRHIPAGWLFAVFELNDHNTHSSKIEIPVSENLREKPN